METGTVLSGDEVLAIRSAGLRKSYGAFEALKGLDLRVAGRSALACWDQTALARARPLNY